MYGVSKLHNLVTLNLANNGILTIEGIKDMVNLQTLCLAGNNIKVNNVRTLFCIFIAECLFTRGLYLLTVHRTFAYKRKAGALGSFREQHQSCIGHFFLEKLKGRVYQLFLNETSIYQMSLANDFITVQELFLHNNRIITLRQCERYLPTALETLTLANNNITDLNEMSHLGGLTSLVNFSITNNPCVSMSGNSMYPFCHNDQSTIIYIHVYNVHYIFRI